MRDTTDDGETPAAYHDSAGARGVQPSDQSARRLLVNAGLIEVDHEGRNRLTADGRDALARLAPQKAASAKATPPSPRDRALAANLSPEEADAYAAWVVGNPGKSVAQWQAMRRKAAAKPSLDPDRGLNGRGNGDAQKAAGEAVRAPTLEGIRQSLQPYNVRQLRGIAQAVDIVIPPPPDGKRWTPDALRDYIARIIERDRGRFTWR